MDSKEALELLTTFLKPTVWKDGFEIRNLKSGEVKTIEEIVDIIYKDLEILEILKNKKISRYYWNSNVVLALGESLSKEEENNGLDKKGKRKINE